MGRGFCVTCLFSDLFDQISNLVLVPAAGTDKTVFLALNTLLCYFFLMFSFLYQYRYKSLTLPASLFLLGFGGLFWYLNLVSPISTLVSMGISADITYLRGYDEMFYKFLYWLSFAFLTGAFTSTLAYFYTPRLSSYW